MCAFHFTTPGESAVAVVFLFQLNKFIFSAATQDIA